MTDTPLATQWPNAAEKSKIADRFAALTLCANVAVYKSLIAWQEFMAEVTSTMQFNKSRMKKNNREEKTANLN